MNKRRVDVVVGEGENRRQGELRSTPRIQQEMMRGLAASANLCWRGISLHRSTRRREAAAASRWVEGNAVHWIIDGRESRPTPWLHAPHLSVSRSRLHRSLSRAARARRCVG